MRAREGTAKGKVAPDDAAVLTTLDLIGGERAATTSYNDEDGPINMAGSAAGDVLIGGDSINGG